MRTIILTLSLFALCSCNGFLRELADKGNVASFTFPCGIAVAADLPDFTFKTDNQYAAQAAITVPTTLHITGASGATNDLTYTCSIGVTAAIGVADGKCTNEEKRKECVEVSLCVLCLEKSDINTKNQ